MNKLAIKALEVELLLRDNKITKENWYERFKDIYK
jgi:hypothetical protein